MTDPKYRRMIAAWKPLPLPGARLIGRTSCAELAEPKAGPKSRLMIAAWKRLPLPVAMLIGPTILRGVG